MMRMWIAAGAAAVILALATFGSYEQWVGQGEFALPKTAYVALAIGAVFTIGLGCALMGLVFYSSRRGYDERADKGIR